ncbi:protein lin-12-like [Ciona intestinalis]
MGTSCEVPCVFGEEVPKNSGFCQCDACYHGVSCDTMCGGNGNCTAGSCDCTNDDGLNTGNWGAYCDQPSCPGIGVPCSGKGTCNLINLECWCDHGWKGSGCHVPDCPGELDCNGRSVCNATTDPPSCTHCDEGWFGDACEKACVFGTPSNEVCVCDSCHTGVACNVECSGYGACVEGACSCQEAWWGDKCETQGCPGIAEYCTGHGHCSILEQSCHCYSGWKGTGCSTPDCPGAPDCFDRGDCDAINFAQPMCVNCTGGYIGGSCNIPCIHGYEDPPQSEACVCSSVCYSGDACDVTCSNKGTCENGNTCVCQEGYQGETCGELHCPGEEEMCTGRGSCVRINERSVCVCSPGFGGEDCSELICPGEPYCNSRGACTLLDSVPQCVCDHGFDGDACERCRSRYTGSLCDRCISGRVGYSSSCEVPCFHGYGEEG